MSDRLDGVHACVFDAYGTLFDVHSAVARHAERIGPQHALLSSEWRRRQLEYTWVRALMGAHVDFWQVTGEALSVSLEHLGIANRSLHDDLMQAYLALDAFADVRPALQLLRRAGVTTAVLSNGSPRMIEAALESAGIADLVDQALSVESVGIYKPDPRVYQLAVDRLGLSAEAISFQSSNSWDAAGAAHFGCRVVWINRYAQPAEALPGKPDAVLPDLSGLPGLLGIC